MRNLGYGFVNHKHATQQFGETARDEYQICKLERVHLLFHATTKSSGNATGIKHSSGHTFTVLSGNVANGFCEPCCNHVDARLHGWRVRSSYEAKWKVHGVYVKFYVLNLTLFF